MSRRIRGTLAAFVLTAMSAFAQRPPPREHGKVWLVASAPADALTPGARLLVTLPFATREALRKEGQALLNQGAGDNGMVRAVLRFERPREEVFAIITRPAEQASYLPYVTQSKSVDRTAEGETTDTVVSFLFTFRYRMQHWFYPEEHRMEWSLGSSGESGLAVQEGFYQLYELDEKTTLAEYGTRVVAQDGLLNYLLGLAARDQVALGLRAIRRHVATAKP